MHMLLIINRGIDVLKNIRIPKSDIDNSLHTQISKISA